MVQASGLRHLPERNDFIIPLRKLDVGLLYGYVGLRRLWPSIPLVLSTGTTNRALASGLIAGESLAGVFFAITAAFGGRI